LEATNPHITSNRWYEKKLSAFAIYWLTVFLLYLPTAEAGRVGDFPGWVRFINSVNFWDYINRSESGIPSLYQFTQIITYFFYQFFKGHAWPWHLLYVTLQAANAMLLFIFSRKLFFVSQVKDASVVALLGAFLFCVCPHISEVVVWEPAFHYMLGFLLMLLVLICAQNFILTQQKKYAWQGGIIFFLSTFSLEVFYLTPLFVISLGFYYAILLGYGKRTLRRLLLLFTLPQACMFLTYMLLLRSLYHETVAHIGSPALQMNTTTFSKPLKYVFHVVFMGRYFPNEIRQKVYHFCESALGFAIFYVGVFSVFIVIIGRYRKLQGYGKGLALLFIFVLLSIGLITPLWFPDTGFVLLDRYTYVLCGFLYMLIALLLAALFRNRVILLSAAIIVAAANIAFTTRANSLWQKSAHVVNTLVETFPNDPSKKVLLLNLPECLNGVQMVGSRDDGEFKMMYNAIMPQKLPNPVYDVEAFYMIDVKNGANVRVLNDSTARVTLNEWGTWWLYFGFGATSYENADYRVDMRDVGHTYDVILKHNPSEYRLLYSVGDKWRIVDWGKKGIDQF
jgi:hypothetical protein